MRQRRARFVAAVVLLVPAVLLIVIGVLVLALQRSGTDVALGVLILVMCAVLLAATMVVLFALKRQADVAQLQADFLSKVSHDFRTPLTSIRMFVETLREGRIADDARRERVLTLLADETERLSTLIDRLLEFARMETGKIRYERRPVDLGELVRRVAERFEPRTLQPGVQLDVDVAPDLPKTLADPDALAEVVQSLVDNAFKYTGDDKRIVIRVAREGEMVAVAVADNGPGIARQHQGRVFDQFYRVDDRLARATEGSGLGLAISRHVVLAHGGRIRVESDRGKGATFVVTLPCA
jgi:two-component system phosphate regulon sensor histidine kinase PhoR